MNLIMPQPDSSNRKPQVKIKRLEAQLRKEKLMERVAELDPILAAELRAADALLDAYKSTQGMQYMAFRSTSKAIIACLEAKGGPMRPREIALDLAEGGFAMDPSNGPRLIVDSCRLMVERGKLKRVDQGDEVDLIERPSTRS